MSIRAQNLAQDTRHGLFVSLNCRIQLTRLSNKQDWTRILTDPDPPEMARMLHVGQFVTWPKVRDLLGHHWSYHSLVLSCT